VRDVFVPDDPRGTTLGGPSLTTYAYGPRGYVDRGLDWSSVGWTGRQHRHEAVRSLDAVDPVEPDVDEEEQDTAVDEDDARQEAGLAQLVEEQLDAQLRELDAQLDADEDVRARILAWQEAEGYDELGELVLSAHDYADADADLGGFDVPRLDLDDLDLPPRRTSDERAS
jgi:hypothetical protein